MLVLSVSLFKTIDAAQGLLKAEYLRITFLVGSPLKEEQLIMMWFGKYYTYEPWASAEIFPGGCNVHILLVPAMSNPRPACGPVECYVRPSLDCRCSKNMLYSDNLSQF